LRANQLLKEMSMRSRQGSDAKAPTRRDFLRRSGGALTAAGLTQALAGAVHAGEDHTIRVALVGCGGRGTGAAANALRTEGPVMLWAMADVFEDRLAVSHASLDEEFSARMDVPPERRFLGFDAYRQAIDAVGKGGVVLLTTPPAFRPLHLEYAVERGVHVFMEKSFAVDAPGVRRVLRAGERAREKNLKIAGGLMWRHCAPRQELVRRLQEGAIGDVVTLYAYRVHHPVDFHPRAPGQSELAHQIRNYSCFTWLNGSFFVDWLIHDIDVCCWIKNAWPVSAQGQGGRQVRRHPDQLFDHFAVEYTFADGSRLIAQGRHMAKCWSFFGDVIHGARGSAVVMEGWKDPPRIYRGLRQVPDTLAWTYDGPSPDPYQVEHDRLFEAIRRDLPHNETERCCRTVQAAILGRMAVESGQCLTWEQAMASTRELAPGLDTLSWEGGAPVKCDAQGQYPIALPGVTEVL
jgi:predicted dehydrogenase